MTLPTRTSADVNASADINSLQAQITGLQAATRINASTEAVAKEYLLVRFESPAASQGGFIAGRFMSGGVESRMWRQADVHIVWDSDTSIGSGDDLTVTFYLTGELWTQVDLHVYKQTDADSNTDYLEVWADIGTYREIDWYAYVDKGADQVVTIYEQGQAGTLPVSGGVVKRKQSQLDIYSTLITYVVDELSTFEGRIYKSLQNNNNNNIPDVSTSWWKDISGSGGAKITNDDITPTADETFVDTGSNYVAIKAGLQSGVAEATAISIQVTDNTSNGDGGDIDIDAGAATGAGYNGGSITVTAGSADSTGLGGNVNLKGGDAVAADAAGEVIIDGGDCSGAEAGDVTIRGGVGNGGSENGSIFIGTANTDAVTIGATGSVTTIQGAAREPRLAIQPASNAVPLAIATTQYVIDNAGGGGGGDFEAAFPAGGLDLPSTNFAPFSKDAGSNQDIYYHAFDDSTPEFVEGQFTLPSAIAGTVTFEIIGYAATAAASKNVEFTFDHTSKADSEGWDAAFSSKVSGDLATDSVQDDIDRFTFTETVTNLTWAANDLIKFRLSRTAPSANNLSGDYHLIHFKIIVPRS